MRVTGILYMVVPLMHLMVTAPSLYLQIGGGSFSQVERLLYMEDHWVGMH